MTVWRTMLVCLGALVASSLIVFGLFSLIQLIVFGQISW